MERQGEKPAEERKLTLRGGSVEGERGVERNTKEKESGSKLWVVLMLTVSVIVSLVFSMKNRVEVPNQKNEGVNTNKGERGGSSLFGPAEYEYEK